jgi:hypothetical protein
MAIPGPEEATYTLTSDKLTHNNRYTYTVLEPKPGDTPQTAVNEVFAYAKGHPLEQVTFRSQGIEVEVGIAGPLAGPRHLLRQWFAALDAKEAEDASRGRAR